MQISAHLIIDAARLSERNSTDRDESYISGAGTRITEYFRCRFGRIRTEAKFPAARRILCNNGNYSIEDLGSTNGTYVNRGRRLIPAIRSVW